MRFPLYGPHGGAPYRIQVLETHDGDTESRCRVDLGGDHESAEIWSIRLRDVWAPELDQRGGPECRAFVERWAVENSDGSDWPLMLETFRTPRSDKPTMTLSRFVGVIWAANGRVLNDDVAAFIAANGYPRGIGAP